MTRCFEAGEYAEDVVINDLSITLDVYNPGDEVAVTGAGGDALITIGGTVSDAVYIKNLRLEGDGDCDGVCVGTTGDVVLDGNFITNCYAGVFDADSDLSNLTMNNNTFEGNKVPVEPLITDPGNNTLNGRVDIYDDQGTFIGITQSIQEAVDRAGENYTLKVHPWTYKEQVVIEKPLSLISTDGRDDTIIDSTEDADAQPVSALLAAAPAAPERAKRPAAERVEREQPAIPEGVEPPFPLPDEPSLVDNGATVPAVFVFGYPVLIEGFEITGLYMYNADGSTLRDNRFTRYQSFGGALLEETDAIWEVVNEEWQIVQPVVIEGNEFTANGVGMLLLYSFDLTVNANEFSNNDSCGLLTDHADGLVLTGNTFTGNGYGAFLCDTWGWRPVAPVQISGNTSSGAVYHGLVLMECGLVSVAENSLNNNGLRGLVGRKVFESQITDNSVAGNVHLGLSMTFSGWNSITGNAVVDNGTWEDNMEHRVLCGMALFDCWENEISGNVIEGNTDAGVFLKFTAYNRITKNNILNNGHPEEENARYGLSYGGILVEDNWYWNQVQFNNITGNIPYGLVIPEECWYDAPPAGEAPPLPEGPIAAAVRSQAMEAPNGGYRWPPFLLNWWGDPSGPVDEMQGYWVGGEPGNLLGEGQEVYAPLWTYAPWLSAPFETEFPGPEAVLPLPLGTGWHLISTPLDLGLDSWEDVVQLGVDLDASIILRYDSENKEWQTCNSGTTFDPLDAYFIRLNSGDLLPLVINSNFTAPPVRMLQQGWNLTSLATNDWRMEVKDALASVEQTPDGSLGWVQVVKPPFPAGLWDGTYSWSCTKNSTDAYYMYPYEGYWVYMENADELAGFSATAPLWEADSEWWYEMAARVLARD